MTIDASALAAVPLFSEVERQHLEALTALLRRRHFDAGEVIFEKGDPGNSLIIIEEGEVRISLHGQAGKEVELVRLSDGESFGELALLDGEPRSATATSTAATQALVLSRSSFQSVLESSPSVALALLRSLTAMVRQADARVADVALLDMHGRISREILRLNDRYGEDAPKGMRKINRAVSAAEIAAATGLHANEVETYLRNYQFADQIRMDGSSMTIVDLDVFRRAVAP
jgi:CRP-like cAMP-binding protein